MQRAEAEFTSHVRLLHRERLYCRMAAMRLIRNDVDDVIERIETARAIVSDQKSTKPLSLPRNGELK